MSLRDRNHAAVPRVLVTGSLGQLGAAFVRELSGPAHVEGVDIDILDITRKVDVAAFARDLRPTLLINCAAFNDVDGAELAPEQARLVNTEAVWTLARVAREVGATLVHYSTDFVFDGTQEAPYVEEDAPAPRSVYGMSKLLSEEAAASVERHYVLRLSSLYGGHTRKTGVDRTMEQAICGQPVQAFADRTVSPSYVPDVVRTTLALVERGARFGLYHCGSTGWCTWSELAAHILERLGRPELLRSVPFTPSDYRAHRPKHCALANLRLEREGLQVLHWRVAVDDYLGRIGRLR
jgi:dTDP-4-dehydrorhamnose reductase